VILFLDVRGADHHVVPVASTEAVVFGFTRRNRFWHKAVGNDDVLGRLLALLPPHFATISEQVGGRRTQQIGLLLLAPDCPFFCLLFALAAGFTGRPHQQDRACGDEHDEIDDFHPESLQDFRTGMASSAPRSVRQRGMTCIRHTAMGGRAF